MPAAPMARHRPRRIPRGMGDIGLNGLCDAFARLGCVEEAHVADGAVLFRVDGAEASAFPVGASWRTMSGPPMSGTVPARPTRRDGSEAAALARLGAIHDGTTERLMARVLRVGSPELFDDTDDEPAVVTGYVHGEYVPAICETCGDFPEHLGITYVTRGGRPECETYPDFGLDDVLNALERSR